MVGLIPEGTIGYEKIHNSVRPSLELRTITLFFVFPVFFRPLDLLLANHFFIATLIFNLVDL